MLTKLTEMVLLNDARALVGKRTQHIRLMCIPAKADRICLFLPGYRASLLGHQRKYLNIAERMLKQYGVPSVLSSGYDQLSPFNYSNNLINHVRATLGFTIEMAECIAGHVRPQLFVFGCSAGAGAIAAVAHEYPQVSKLVLVSPSTGDVGDRLASHGISRFAGEMTILAGNLDVLIGLSSARLLVQKAECAKSVKYYKIRPCDHAFRGRVNKLIFQQAAFDGFCDERDLVSYDKKIEQQVGQVERKGVAG